MKYVTVTVELDGTVKAEAHGFKGPACLKALACLDGLGTVIERKKKPEFDQKEETCQRVTS